MGLTAKTVRKWRDRFAAEGETGLPGRLSIRTALSVMTTGANAPKV